MLMLVPNNCSFVQRLGDIATTRASIQTRMGANDGYVAVKSISGSEKGAITPKSWIRSLTWTTYHLYWRALETSMMKLRYYRRLGSSTAVAVAVIQTIRKHMPLFVVGHNCYSYDNRVLCFLLGFPLFFGLLREAIPSPQEGTKKLFLFFRLFPTACLLRPSPVFGWFCSGYARMLNASYICETVRHEICMIQKTSSVWSNPVQAPPQSRTRKLHTRRLHAAA